MREGHFLLMKYQKNEFILVPNKSSIKGLEPTLQVLFMWLCDHSDDGMKSFPSRKILAAECGISIRTLDRGMQELVKLGFIAKSARYNGSEQTTNLYEVVIVAHPSVKSALGRADSARGGDKFDTQNSTHLTQPIKLNRPKGLVNSALPHSPTRNFKNLFIEIVEALGFSPEVRVTPGRMQKLKTRNRTYKYDELMTAARNLGADAYMQGENEQGKRWGTIDYFLRSDETVAKYLELGDKQQIKAGEIDESKYL